MSDWIGIVAQVKGFRNGESGFVRASKLLAEVRVTQVQM